MNAEKFIEQLKIIGIDTFIGVPDSTLSSLCAHLNQMDTKHHMCTVNEGAAVGLAAGHYLSTGKPACVYMQNSGLGNAVNPITSLMHQNVYDIPTLYLIGHRGKPGLKDEPQHVFQGEITWSLLDLLEIKHAQLTKETTLQELDSILMNCNKALSNNQSYALVIEKGTFQSDIMSSYTNAYTYIREDAIHTLIKATNDNDVFISTTGKISRELYEQLEKIKGNHKQAFLTVGSMGHASMIAYGMAQSFKDKRLICLDGDGAVLMHMGSLAFLAKQKPENFVHIVLNNGAHESVGGMPTGASGKSLAEIAHSCGYPYTISIQTKEEFTDVLEKLDKLPKPCMIEVMVKMESRDDLGRPKETPIENKQNFMKYNEVKK